VAGSFGRLFVDRKVVVEKRFGAETQEYVDRLFEVDDEVPVLLGRGQILKEEFAGDCKVAFQEERKLRGKVCRQEGIQ
jgi:hypothetical protein